jgi:MFS family permease
MNERRIFFNMFAFAGDFVAWSVGMTFIGQTTVLPTFVRHFTDSSFLIGLITTIQNGGFLVPQLIVSNLIAHRARKKPIMLLAGIFYRPLLWLFALFLVLMPNAPGTQVLVVFFVMYTLFNIGDSIATVPWFDIMGKSVSPSRRGRTMGIGQVIIGILAIGAGALVDHLLGDSGPGFPLSYALCFAIAGTGAMLSWASEFLLYEVIQPVAEKRMALGEYLPALGRVLHENGHFRLVTAARLLSGMANMALPFYIIFARDRLHFAADTIGLFITAQVVGGVLAGTVLGFLSERSGSKAVILAALAIQLTAPLLALLIFATQGVLGDWATWLYALVFIAVAIGQNSGILGFTNYVLELAPPQERVTYIGLTNTLSGVLAVAPLVGALVIENLSYMGMFVIVALLLLASLVTAAQMTEPRKSAMRHFDAQVVQVADGG